MTTLPPAHDLVTELRDATAKLCAALADPQLTSAPATELVDSPANAAYITLMRPDVGFHIAKMLEHSAAWIEEFADREEAEEEVPHALAVARLINGTPR